MYERIINPSDTIYPATPDYVHGLELSDVSRTLLVSGTMGLDTKGDAPDTLEEQLVLIWANIERILKEADMSMKNIVRVTSYLGSRDHAETNQQARIRALGDRRIPTTAIIVEIYDPKWFVEIEVVAAA